MQYHYDAPSKTFLIGEYGTLKGGPALILNTKPRFKLCIQPADPDPKRPQHNIAPQSPAGILMHKHRNALRQQQLHFYDPHHAAGGFGASSAQFAMLWCHLHPQQKLSTETILADYHACQDPSLTRYRPSGSDILAQLTGHVTHYQPAQDDAHTQATRKAYHWPFPDLYYSLLKTDLKVETHRHLMQLGHRTNSATKKGISHLIMLAKRGIDAFLQQDALAFGQIIHQYHQALIQQDLVHPRTQQHIQQLQQYVSITSAKGCGALGADVIFVLLTADQRPGFQHYIVSHPTLTEMAFGQHTAPSVQQIQPVSIPPTTSSIHLVSEKKWEVTMPANLALIKYMGKHNYQTNLPTNPSLSYTLQDLTSSVQIALYKGKKTPSKTVDHWRPLHAHFQLSPKEQQRFLSHLSYIKNLFHYEQPLIIRSANHFPSNCGLASSASSFAALTACAVRALSDLTGRDLFPEPNAMAHLSRQASGSSCRSFFLPWALWDGETVKAIELPYQKLVHHVIVVEKAAKNIPSSVAHQRCQTSPLFKNRPQRARTRLIALIAALQKQQWPNAFRIAWDEFQEMHHLFETAKPPFHYLTPASHALLNDLKAFWQQHQDGPLVSMDAGANIHLLFRPNQIACMEHIAAHVEQSPFPIEWI